KALPVPQGEAYKRQRYEAPQGELEEILAQHWGELLGLEQVGRHDNFFELGGDSMRAISVAAAIRRSGYLCEVPQLFTHQTIASLAAYLADQENVIGDTNLVPSSCLQLSNGIVDKRDAYLLRKLEISQEQALYLIKGTQKKWIEHTFRYPGDEAWWVSLLLQVELSPAKDLSIEKLKKSWAEVSTAFPCLRSRFHFENERLYQIVDKELLIDIHDVQLSDVTQCHTYLASKMRERYDMSHRHAVRQFVIRLDTGDVFHAFLVHHGLVDGWNLGGIINHVYARALGVSSDLPSANNYQEWILHCLRQAEGNSVDAVNDRQFANAVGLPLPPRYYQRRSRLRVQQPAYSFDKETSQAFFAVARRNSATPYLLLEAVWAMTLQQLSGALHVSFVSLDSGRASALAGVESLTANTLTESPVLASFSERPGLGGLLNQLKLQRQAALMGEAKVSNQVLGRFYDSLLISRAMPAHHADAPNSDQEQTSPIRFIDQYDPCPYRLALVYYQSEEISGFFEYFTDDLPCEDFDRIYQVFMSTVKDVAFGKVPQFVSRAENAGVCA
ncbi:condensation domain-containing protein, partial [Roseateles sp. DB2]|uniref:condensation domain-containing protein n=1 Tax=Roseateles sp. DB2 TaxID=3453717 RepID=UPI003EEE07E3